MRNNPGGFRRPKWLNTYRIITALAILALLVMNVVTLNMLSDVSDRSFAPISNVQTDKIAQAASYLQYVGFNNPVYKGVTPGVEGEYPTFTATAIGGKPVDLWIRTTRNGGWEIQPVNVYHTVKSADDFARLAKEAVYNWQNMPSSIQPRTDGAFGDYEARKYHYNLLAKYNPEDSYWQQAQADETTGWPKK